MLHVAGLFRSSYEIDKAVNQLLSQQFQGSQLRAVPMHKTEAAPQSRGLRGWLIRGGVLGDTLERSDGTSVLDGAAAGATVGGLIGVIAGAAAAAGPVTLGVAGILGGGLIGYLLDRAIPERERLEYQKALCKGGTLLVVMCRGEAEAKAAALILKENQAHQLGRWQGTGTMPRKPNS